MEETECAKWGITEGDCRRAARSDPGLTWGYIGYDIQYRHKIQQRFDGVVGYHVSLTSVSSLKVSSSSLGRIIFCQCAHLTTAMRVSFCAQKYLGRLGNPTAASCYSLELLQRRERCVEFFREE